MGGRPRKNEGQTDAPVRASLQADEEGVPETLMPQSITFNLDAGMTGEEQLGALSETERGLVGGRWPLAKIVFLAFWSFWLMFGISLTH